MLACGSLIIGFSAAVSMADPEARERNNLWQFKAFSYIATVDPDSAWVIQNK